MPLPLLCYICKCREKYAATRLAVPENNRFYDLFFIYHPDNVSIVRRIAAQLSAMGSVCRFEEDDFRKSAVDIAELKDGVLRSHVVGVVLSPESAASQLCNELIQQAVNNSKRIVSLILDEDIEVEVHPAIADNPFVFFRERDNLAEQVDELRQHLKIDHETRLHTELLVTANIWQRRGRRPSQLLAPERAVEARQWLADAGMRTLKPSPLLVEFIHSSRRQRPPSAGSFRRARLGLAVIAVVALALGFLLLRAALEASQTAQAAAAQTQAAQTQLALTGAASTAASDSAVSLVDALAATSAVIAESVKQTAQAAAATATQAAYATETAYALATVARATEIYEQARDADAARLVDAAEAALAAGDRELALALAWVAKDAMDTPKRAYRVLRRATARSSSAMLKSDSMPRFQPGGAQFALIADGGLSLRIYESANWSLKAEASDHEAPISQLAYSPDGSLLVSASLDGEILLRAADSGAVRIRLAGHEGAITALAFDPSGDRLYSAGREPALAAWDLASGDALAVYSPDESEAPAIAELLATADGDRIISWATVDGKPVMTQWAADTLEPASAEAELVYRGVDAAGLYGYSGGNSLPAYPGDPNTGDLVIWDLASGGEITRLNNGFNWSLGDLTAPSDDLLFISFHEDAALVGVTSGDGGQRAVLVSLADGSVIRQFEKEPAADLASAAFVDSQTILSRTRDERVILWSLADGGVIREVVSAGPDLMEIGFNPAANTIIGWEDDGRAYLWRMSDSSGEAGEILTDALPGSGISPSGEALHLLGADGLRLISLDTGETIKEIDAQFVRQRGAFIAVSEGAGAALYDSESGDELGSWSGDWEGLQALRIAADGERLLAVDDSNSLWLLASDREEPLALDASIASLPARVEFSANGERMLSLLDERAILWDANSGQALGEYALDGESMAGVDAAFGPDGDTLLFFVQLENGLASLTAVTGTENVTWRRSYLGVAAGALSRDGSALLLAQGESGLRIISAIDGEVAYHLPMATEIPEDWRYLPEAGLLAIAAGRELSIWDVSDGELDQRFRLGQPIAEFSLSDDGRHIVARDIGGAHRLLRIEQPAELLRRIEADSPARELTCAERVRYLVLPLCE